ncbi:MAG: HD domain-containing protein [Candidatus Geothermincolia bacterium]
MKGGALEPDLLKVEYETARSLAAEIVVRHGIPRFYLEKSAECERSRALFEGDETVGRCLELVRSAETGFGHGLAHSMKVALDAGAITLIEASIEEAPRLARLAHLAGLLHDIKRKEKDHAQAGSAVARELLANMGLGESDSGLIAVAIGNHEAFHEPAATAGDGALISDALYDADKFRWGPDNFAYTLWDMIEPMGITMRQMVAGFERGMAAIERIKDSFRTDTGRIYGPDFIELGMDIGAEIRDALAERFC